MSHKHLILRRTFLSGALLVPVLITGCTGKPGTSNSGATKAQESHLISGWDESGSQDAASKRAYFALFNALLEEATPHGAHLTLLGFASPREAHTVWNNPIRDSSDLSFIQQKLKDLPPDGPGTYAAPMLRQLLAEAKGSQATFAVVICTDGGWNDYAQAQVVARQLAALPQIKAVLVGPLPLRGNARNRIETTFADFGAERLITCNFNEAEAAITRFRAAWNR